MLNLSCEHTVYCIWNTTVYTTQVHVYTNITLWVTTDQWLSTCMCVCVRADMGFASTCGHTVHRSHRFWCMSGWCKSYGFIFVPHIFNCAQNVPLHAQNWGTNITPQHVTLAPSSLLPSVSGVCYKCQMMQHYVTWLVCFPLDSVSSQWDRFALSAVHIWIYIISEQNAAE